MKITKKDVKIITKLRNNARERLTKISRKTGVPVSTIFDRLRLHEGAFIQKHTTLIDFHLLGFASKAKILLKVSKKERMPLKAFIEKNPYINSAYRINNGFDFLIELISRNMRELEDFVEQIEERFTIQEKLVFYVVDEIKKEHFLTQEESAKYILPQVLEKGT